MIQNRIAIAVLSLVILFLSWHLFFSFATITVDSVFYHAIGTYIFTGIYPYVESFVYSRPTTISPPLYGIVLVAIEYLPKPDLMIHIVQLGLLVFTGYLVYRTLLLSFSRSYALIGGGIFILIPANGIYASLLMTENGGSFFIAAIICFLTYGLKKKNSLFFGYAVVFSSFATLWKYSNILLFFVSIGIWILYARRLAHMIFPTVAIGILMVWFVTNYMITGVVGLSDASGIQLYNQFVSSKSGLPDSSDPSMIRLRQYIPLSVDIQKPYWELQYFILQKEGMRWVMVDRVLGDVARAAVRQHPWKYLWVTVYNFFHIHASAGPYWENMGSYGKTANVLPFPPYCGYLGTIHLCTPLISSNPPYRVWNKYVSFSDTFYHFIYPIICYGILFPSVIILFLKGDTIERLWAVLYIMIVLSITGFVHDDPRYIVPLYPLAVCICFSGVRYIYQLIQHSQVAEGFSRRIRLTSI